MKYRFNIRLLNSKTNQNRN